MFVQFYIPRGSVKLGQVIDACIAQCVERWGGCTMSEGIGYWRPPNSVLTQAEPVAILNVSCQDGSPDGICPPTKTVRRWFDTLATYVRVKADQHTVHYQMFRDAAPRFVGPSTILAEPPTEGVGR